MSMTDPIADMLTRIRNGSAARHSSVEVSSSEPENIRTVRSGLSMRRMLRPAMAPLVPIDLASRVKGSKDCGLSRRCGLLCYPTDSVGLEPIHKFTPIARWPIRCAARRCTSSSYAR